MEVLIQITTMAFLAEAIWETMKLVVEKGSIEFNRVGALVVGIIIAVTVRVDIFEAIGLTPSVGYVGVLATGILISRGSNYVHDLFSRLEPYEPDDY